MLVASKTGVQSELNFFFLDLATKKIDIQTVKLFNMGTSLIIDN